MSKQWLPFIFRKLRSFPCDKCVDLGHRPQLLTGHLSRRSITMTPNRWQSLLTSPTRPSYIISPSAVDAIKQVWAAVQNESLHTLDSIDLPSGEGNAPHDALMVLLPLLIVLSTFLFMLLFFLVCVILIRRRRGIVLRDRDGPVDMSREELIDGEGGFEGVESRWMESVSEPERREYLRAKGVSKS